MNLHYYLNNNEYAVYQSIIDALSHNEKPTIKMIAAANFVSTTYVIKVAKKLGYSSYSEMIFALKNREKNLSDKQDVPETFLQTGNEDLFIESLKQFHSQRIFCIGVGYSEIVTKYIVKKLSELGFDCYDGSPVDMKIPLKDYLCIVVSRSGETEDIVEIIKRLKDSRRIILITATENNSLTRLATESYVIANEDHSALDNQPDLFISKSIGFFETTFWKLINDNFNFIK